MDFPSKTIVDVLTYLLPGFVSAALVYSLTPVQRSVPFERVVQALIYTIVVQALLVLVRTLLLLVGRWCIIGVWTQGVALAWSVALAVALGCAAAWAHNSDSVHSLLRKLGITLQTSFATEWYGAFSQNNGYVVLHLPGGRRLMGWAEEWPSAPDQGHFVLTDPQWLTDGEPVDLEKVNRIVVRARDVEMVEMMKPAS